MAIYPWGHERRFNAYSNYFSGIFGGRVQKVSIDAGFTCPNRDGTLATGGCTFCNNDAFSPSYCTPEMSIKDQVMRGIEFHKKRYPRAVGYLAYFQSYTNTYSSVDRLKELYSESLSVPGVLGLIVGTRPDSIDDQKLDLLEDISKSHYVAVEFGIESCYDRTLVRINRGHDFSTSLKAVENSSKRGINTGAHFIFGLPGETREDMLNEASIISQMPLSTVKFHQLQIIRGTAMEKEYRDNPSDFQLFGFDEYIDFLIKFLEKLDPGIIVERFTGEAPPSLISVPGWGMKRTDQIMNEFERRMEELDSWQGKLYQPLSNLDL